jgi:hypothetical protein
VSLVFQEDPKWVSLLDGNDVLRLAWACRTLRHEDEVLMYTLQCRARTQVGRRPGRSLGGGGGDENDPHSWVVNRVSDYAAS